MTDFGAAACGLARAAGSELEKASAGAEATLAGMARETPELQHASQIYAKNVLVRQQFVRRLLKPFESWVSDSKDYFDTGFVDDMASKTAFIPEEDLVLPAPSILVPAVQGLAYSKDEPSLKDMYLELLATASDGRNVGGAHPSYAEIIKQLASEEAVILSLVAKDDAGAIVALRRSKPGESKGFTFRRHLLPLTLGGKAVTSARLSSYVDNWARLGLFTVEYDKYLVRDGAYDWAEELPEVVDARANTPEVTEVVLVRGVLRRTDFGESFSRAVGILDSSAPRDGYTPESLS